MPEISAVIITYNEEKYIEQCINSTLDVADEIVVVDSYSTDRTPEICKKLGVKFVQQKFLGYQEQKNFALKQTSFDYVLSLDADEALSAELCDSILSVKENISYDGYKFKRLNNYCGKWIFHTSLYPERKIRLFNKHKGKWGGINPHDKFEMFKGAKVGYLKGHILHWVYDTIDEHVSKINSFSYISANEYFKLGYKSGLCRMFFHSFWRFLHSYIIKLGFLEGTTGFVISVNVAYQCFLKYAKLNSIKKENNNKKGGNVNYKRVWIAVKNGKKQV